MARASKTGVRGLFRGKDGRWRIDLRWREAGTGEWRRYCQRLPDGIAAAAAKNRAREILSAALAGGFEPRKEAPRRLGDALDEYITWAEVNRPRTVAGRRSLAKSLRRMGDPRLDELSPFLVEKFKRDRRAENASPATVNRAVAMLKHLCGLAAEWGWMPEPKARAIRAVKLLREPPGRVRYLCEAEEGRLFGSMSKHLRPIVLAALLSGMRLGEIVTLRKDAVDLKNRLITLKRTKTNKVRGVPVNDALAAVLEQAASASTGEFLFTNRKGKSYTRDGVRCLYRRAVEKAGIEDLHFHDLRHDFATRLRRRGVGLDEIAALLGHSSLAMAQRYAHIVMENLHAAVAGLAMPKIDPPGEAVPSTPDAQAASGGGLRSV